jgi:hypothetical protein
MPKRVYVEQEPVTLVMKSVDRQFDVVVIGRSNRLPSCQVSADGMYESQHTHMTYSLVRS